MTANGTPRTLLETAARKDHPRKSGCDYFYKIDTVVLA